MADNKDLFWGVNPRHDEPIIKTDLYDGDQPRSNYSASDIARYANNDLETYLSNMVRSGQIRGGRKRRERQKDKYRQEFNSMRDELLKGNSTYKGGQLNIDGYNFDGKYAKAMYDLMTGTIKTHPSIEYRPEDTLLNYVRTKLNLPNRSENEIYTYLKSLGHDENKIHELINGYANEYVDAHRGIDQNRYNAAFLNSLGMYLRDIDQWNKYSQGYKDFTDPFAGYTVQDDAILANLGWHRPGGSGTPAASSVRQLQMIKTPDIKNGALAQIAGIGGAGGSENTQKPVTTDPTASGDAWKWEYITNPNSVEFNYKTGAEDDIYDANKLDDYLRTIAATTNVGKKRITYFDPVLYTTDPNYARIAFDMFGNRENNPIIKHAPRTEFEEQFLGIDANGNALWALPVLRPGLDTSALRIVSFSPRTKTAKILSTQEYNDLGRSKDANDYLNTALLQSSKQYGASSAYEMNTFANLRSIDPWTTQSE